MECMKHFQVWNNHAASNIHTLFKIVFLPNVYSTGKIISTISTLNSCKCLCHKLKYLNPCIFLTQLCEFLIKIKNPNLFQFNKLLYEDGLYYNANTIQVKIIFIYLGYLKEQLYFCNYLSSANIIPVKLKHWSELPVFNKII